MVSFDIDKLREHLEQLKSLPNIKEVIALRKRLQNEINRLAKQEIQKPVEDLQIQANVKRSGKLRRYHNYIRQIKNNFPNLTYSQIRKQLKARKQGLEVDIPDPVWQNPSP
jgi:DNA polymerase/3'-5' exonuclease PolX